MKIRYRLAWAKGPVASKHFKSSAAYELFSGYLKRLSHFSAAEASGISLDKPESSRAVRWFCHTSKTARPFSSEDLARQTEKMRQISVKEWEIVIGPPDGFTKEHLRDWAPAVLWSFGPLTLPHELAAVVASEQVYRAHTILAGSPYHSGH